MLLTDRDLYLFLLSFIINKALVDLETIQRVYRLERKRESYFKQNWAQILEFMKYIKLQLR